MEKSEDVFRTSNWDKWVKGSTHSILHLLIQF